MVATPLTPRPPPTSSAPGFRPSRTPAGRCSCLILFILGLLFLGALSPARADSISKEYQLKAAFLYNFTKFVDWPPERFADNSSPIVIAVLGKNPFGDEMERLVKDRVVNGHPIQVRFIESADDIPSAHIIFVSARSERNFDESIFDHPGVLTVGESSDFAERGGMIRFTLVGEKVRFEINQASSDKAGLKLSGQLLKLAMIVRTAR